MPRLMALAIGGLTLLLAVAIAVTKPGSPLLGLMVGAGGLVLMLASLRIVVRRQWRLSARAFLWLAVLVAAAAVLAVPAGQPVGIALLLLVDAALALGAYIAALQFGRRMERSRLITNYLRD